ncbi:MAG: thioredoxin [Patescibacteria group bacterium]|jgi:thioredoxin 1
MAKALNLTHETFEAEVLKSTLPVLVDFWAPWCGPCQMMAPILDQLSDELKDKVKIAKLDTEVAEHMPLAIQYQIASIPNMKLFYQGKIIQDFIGFRPKATLAREIDEAVKSVK